MSDRQYGYRVGDYVIVSHPESTTDYEPGKDTFKVVGFTENLFRAPLVKVARIDNPDFTTLFYPYELSWEDGTRP